MIKETKNFILDKKEDPSRPSHYLGEAKGLTIKIKNADGTTTDLLDILPSQDHNKNFDSYIQTYSTMFQDCITSWELFVELIEVIDEANYTIEMAVTNLKIQRNTKNI